MNVSKGFGDLFRFIVIGLLFASIIILFNACGSGGGSSITAADSGGATVSGRIGVTGVARTGLDVSSNLESTANAVIELVTLEGDVVQETVADETGSFIFSNVAQGDYKIVVKDADTGEVVTEVEVSVVEGDDLSIEGVISGEDADWTIEFTANSDDVLQNETQMEKAERIAEASGLSVDEVVEMRQSGMGWGKIAKELEVHPGVLGLGNDKAFEDKKTTGANDQTSGSSSGKGNSGSKGDKDKGGKGKGGKDKSKGKPDK